MKFDFFTLGGCQFWEDIFFYQGWRIQRNYDTKVCRLLDNWDIRRHKGTWQSCREAFNKLAEAYEMPKQKGHLVIMLHGLFDSKNIFRPLWREIIKQGDMAVAINYPSTQKGLEAHARQLDLFLDNLEDIQEVSFVTKGIGGIILRKLLSYTDHKWYQKIKIKRIVQVSAPNKGSKLFEMLSNYKIFNLIFGPMLKDASPNKVECLPLFAENTELGIVINESIGSKILSFASDNTSYNNLYNVFEATLSQASDIIRIENKHYNPFKNKNIIKNIMNFLNEGKFKKIMKM